MQKMCTYTLLRVSPEPRALAAVTETECSSSRSLTSYVLDTIFGCPKLNCDGRSVMLPILMFRLCIDVPTLSSPPRATHSGGGHTNLGFIRGTTGGNADLVMTRTTSAMVGRSFGFGLLQAKPRSSRRSASPPSSRYSSLSGEEATINTGSRHSNNLPSW